MKYVCEVCGYVYDPAVGDPDGGIPSDDRLIAILVALSPEAPPFLYIVAGLFVVGSF